MKSCTLVRVTLGLLRKLLTPFHAVLASDMVHQDLVMAQDTTVKISSATKLEGLFLRLYNVRGVFANSFFPLVGTPILGEKTVTNGLEYPITSRSDIAT